MTPDQLVATALPPGPRTPAFVQGFQVFTDQQGLLDRCAARYGDVFTMKVPGFGTVVNLASAKDVRLLYTAPPDVVLAGTANADFFGPVLGTTNVLTLDGAAHLRHRRLLMPPFHGERMAGYAAVIREATLRRMESWPTDRSFPIHPELQSITLEVILRTVFGIDAATDERGRPLAAILIRIAREAVGSPLLLAPFLQLDLGRYSPWGRVLFLLRQAHAKLDEEIARRRAEGPLDRTDILSMLLATRDEDGAPMTNDELRDELLVLLVAGYETTASTLAFVFARVLGTPDARQRIAAELQQEPIAGKDRDAQLPYLDAVIKESMRLRPISLQVSARRLAAPLALTRHTIPAGVVMMACPHLVHRDPELYPDPAEFKPDRFLSWKPAAHEWLPFGGGARRCLGFAFALHEMKIVLATVLRNTTLELAEPTRMGRSGFFLAPAKGTPVIRTAPKLLAA